jgi:DNA repair exonuclease SbcCD ATPase subunit
MRIIKVEWRNFSSYGNKIQSLSFPEEACLFQIVGENGAGKTTISQVIAFGLYGKVEGKKLGDIPNRINGHAWVRIEFENNGRIITVERGLEPSLFKLSIDGIPYDESGKGNVQNYLADELIGIPYYVFNNTISLSINDFKSFIKMSPQDKRAIIDKIFGFNILNQMREILKDEIKNIKGKIDSISGSISSIEKSINRSTEEMNELLNDIKSERDEKIKILEETLSKIEAVQSIHSGKITDFMEEEKKLKSLVFETNIKLSEYRSKLEEINRKIKLYESDICPVCESSLEGEFHHHKKLEVQTDKNYYDSEILNVEKELIDLKTKESDLIKTKKDLDDKGRRIAEKLSEIRSEIKLNSEDNSKDQVKALDKIIKNLNGDLDNLREESHKFTQKNTWIKKLDEILGEKGVKQMAIRTILPSLNSEIMDLVSMLHMDYQVVFDEEFKATIYQMGIEIPVQTLSTGEMKKMDFVVLISIMKLMKLKFTSINLLFLDELFSSVDPDGVSSILRILQKNSKEMGLNIFVINHAPMPHEIFDWKIEIKKTNNFSSMTMDHF